MLEDISITLIRLGYCVRIFETNSFCYLSNSETTTNTQLNIASLHYKLSALQFFFAIHQYWIFCSLSAGKSGMQHEPLIKDAFHLFLISLMKELLQVLTKGKINFHYDHRVRDSEASLLGWRFWTSWRVSPEDFQTLTSNKSALPTEMCQTVDQVGYLDVIGPWSVAHADVLD